MLEPGVLGTCPLVLRSLKILADEFDVISIKEITNLALRLTKSHESENGVCITYLHLSKLLTLILSCFCLEIP